VLSAHAARLVTLAGHAFPPTTAWALFSIHDLILGHGPAWLGIATAAYLCKDGDDILEHVGVYWLTHILMVRRR